MGIVRERRYGERDRERERERKPLVDVRVVSIVQIEFKAGTIYLLARSGEPSQGVSVEQDMA
jgi:hypothetical protein